MRKALHIIILLTAMLLSACGKIDQGTGLPDAQYPYIFFDAEIQQTKANLLDGESLPSGEGTAFGVFGYKGESSDAIFRNGVERMYRKSAKGSFLYDNLTLWTEDIHNFYAYYPYNEAEVGKDETGPYVIYVQPRSLEGMLDFMTASKAAWSYENHGSLVDLKFSHRLFAFDIEVVNEQTEQTEQTTFTISSASITLHGVASEAKLYFDGKNDTNASTADINEKFSFKSENIAADSPLTLNGENSFLLLPTSSLKISFNIKGTDGFGEYDIKVEQTEVSYNFEAGNRYKLEIKKVDGEGFAASISTWGDGDDIIFTFK